MLIKAVLVFAKVGLLTIGGGLAMIPLLQDEIVSRGWISLNEFTHMISIAEMTPGPIIVNLATFTGYKLAGVTGAIACTLGVMFPSFVIVTLFSSILIAHKDNPHIPRVFAVIRPVVVGLIAGAGIGLGIQTLSAAADAGGFSAPLQILGIDLVAAVIFAVSALLLWRTDGHPVKALIVGAVLGIILFSITGG